MQPKIFPIILAGGSGTRLWPLSRKFYPKQFIQLPEFGGKSLFQNTLERAITIAGNSDSLRIVTSADYKFHCITQSEEIGIHLGEKNLLIEPRARNTLAAIAFAVRSLDSESDHAIVMPSDHAIENIHAFEKIVKSAMEIAETSLVTFGIKPDHPNTGYGYIHPSQNAESAPVKVIEFKEKPDLEAAEKYIRAGYLWNAGIFLFSKKIFDSELQKANPMYASVFEKQETITEIFDTLPDLSIDYGLLEKSDNVSVISADIGWTDLGSFDTLEKYVKGASFGTESIEISASGNFSHSDTPKKPIVFIGCENLLAIDTKDALLITQKGSSQKVQEAVNILKQRLPSVTENHLTVYRPWGSYTIIDEGVGFKSKRLSVLPGKKLSVQMHYHRSEHWVVVSGTAIVTVGEDRRILEKGESTFIPAGTKHRLENPGKIVAHLIESQIGDYLEEDDIVRFDDEYGRK
jgi:mannose-1-phosphate guanylyltransferase/mannose-6-phosphate isomerase